MTEYCDADCKEDPIYVFPEMKLRGRFPNFHIHVSVSDYMYISTIGSLILLQQTRQIMEIYKSLTEQECGNWERGRAVSVSF
jgi:hypothetical protein